MRIARHTSSDKLLHKKHQRLFDDGFNLFLPGTEIDVLRSSLDSRYFLQLMTCVLNSVWKNCGTFTCSLPGIRLYLTCYPFHKSIHVAQNFSSLSLGCNGATAQIHYMTGAFTKLLRQLRYFLFQNVLQKVRECAVPCTEWVWNLLDTSCSVVT